MKRTMYLTAALLAAMTAATSCSDDNAAEVTGNPQEGLRVTSVGVRRDAETRAGITATSFTSGETLGLYIYRGTGIGDASKDYNGGTGLTATVNVPYKEDSGTWSAAQPIILSSVQGKVYSYYPYAAGNSTNDGTSIPVSVSAAQGTGQSDGTADAGQTDYMYGNVVSGISNANSTVSLTMNHALAMVTFKFRQTDVTGKAYPGEGKVSAITLRDATYGDISNAVVRTGAGTMNIATGYVTVTGTAATGITLAPDASSTLMDVTAADKLPRMLVYPHVSAIAAGQVVAVITVDGSSYTLPLPALGTGYVRGNNYEYTFTMKGTEMEVTSVEITPWVLNQMTGGDIQTPDPVAP